MRSAVSEIGPQRLAEVASEYDLLARGDQRQPKTRSKTFSHWLRRRARKLTLNGTSIRTPRSQRDVASTAGTISGYVRTT